MAEYGSGYSQPNLTRMIRFAALFPSKEIVSTVSKELSGSHFVELLQIEDAVAREFYVQMCRIERWSVRELHSKIQGMLFERTALSRKPEELACQELALLREEGRITPDLVFRDPYLLDFLGLADTYSERDLETAILRELERFLLELGAGFAFIARQKRIIIDGEDYYIDLKTGKLLSRTHYHPGDRHPAKPPGRATVPAERGAVFLNFLKRFSLRPIESDTSRAPSNPVRPPGLSVRCMAGAPAALPNLLRTITPGRSRFMINLFSSASTIPGSGGRL